ncbi:nitrogenase component 1 [Candidatus Methanomethylophilus sp. 1R26]|uniref:nitrogenase component 1 n=1 Tax=Candidatus Methanomethylophilus sp. 1R26 TaxID=1769296 RepID=UPI0012FEA85A|nr:nitrogenase component 1 [Candidatus Methanomethylophilus sp. 1R26]
MEMTDGLGGAGGCAPGAYVGGVMAAQGIPGAVLVLHGQNGCRKGLSLCNRLYPRKDSPRGPDGHRSVEFTGVTAADYTNGASYRKLEEKLSALSGRYGMYLLFTSPGLSIVGDDCLRAARAAGTGDRVVSFDPDQLGTGCPEGFDTVVREVLRRTVPDREEAIPGTVNVLGLSIMHKDWRCVKQEVGHLLGKAGLKVLSFPGAGSSLEELRASASAEFNIVLCPEHCAKTAAFYTEMFGTPAVSSGESPVGFDAFERFYCRVSDETGHETEHGFQMLKNSRRRAYECILASDTDLTGLSYRIDSVPSTADPLGRWLESSLGMVPAAGRPDVLFAPGDDALFAERSGRCGTGIDIGFPSSAYVDFSKAPVMGLDGAMYILGSLFNRAGRS